MLDVYNARRAEGNIQSCCLLLKIRIYVCGSRSPPVAVIAPHDTNTQQVHSLVHRSLASDGARSVRAHTREAGAARRSPGAAPPNENAPTPAARRPTPTAARRSKSRDKLLPRRFISV